MNVIYKTKDGEAEGVLVSQGVTNGEQYFEIEGYGLVESVKPVGEKEKEYWRDMKFFELKKHAEDLGMEVTNKTKKAEIEAYLVEREGQ